LITERDPKNEEERIMRGFTLIASGFAVPFLTAGLLTAA